MQQSTSKRSIPLPVYSYEDYAKAEMARRVRRALLEHLATRETIDLDLDQLEYELDLSFEFELEIGVLEHIPAEDAYKVAS